MCHRGMIFYRAEQPLHPGSGDSRGAIDNAVQEEVHTGWPMTTVKGAWRSRFRQHLVDKNEAGDLVVADKHQDTTSIFGRDVTSDDDGSNGGDGDLVFPDARVFAFPVRSAKGVFALVTCREAVDDMVRAASLFSGIPSPYASGLELSYEPSVESVHFMQGSSAFTVSVGNNTSRAFLEDLKLKPVKPADGSAEAERVIKLMVWLEDYGVLDSSWLERLALVSGTAFSYFTRNCRMVQQRNRLNSQNKRVENGALWIEEHLPPETVLYSPVMTKPSGVPNTAAYALFKELFGTNPILMNLGGDTSTGKGWCRARLVDGLVQAVGGE